MAYYTIDELTEFIATELDINLDAKRNVVQSKIIQCLRDLPLQRFVVKDMKATLNVVNGIATLPSGLVKLHANPFQWRYNKTLGTLNNLSGMSTVTILYDGLPADEDGITLIPDLCDTAIMLYVTAEYLMRKGLIDRTVSRADYEYAKRDYQNAVGELRGRVNMLSQQEIQNLAIIRRSTIPYDPSRRAGINPYFL